MAPKDYYVILGVSRSESARGLRKAFRDLARQHHPDRAGPAGTPMFRDVVEAYRVLSDPDQRRRHDAELGQPVRVTPTPERRAAPSRRGRSFEARELFAQPDSIRSAADELRARILRNYLEPAIPKGEQREPLLCDVALSRDEALRGGILPIRIPVTEPCPACHGRGRVAGFVCRRCDASGASSSEVVVPLEIAPGVPSGWVVQVPLERWGIRNLWLRARIRVVD